MKKTKHHIIFSLLLFLLIFSSLSCSTKKNTWVSRNYQALTTHYNVNFNGMQSYRDGIRSIESSQQDDYSNIIYMFPVSNHENATAATGQMNLAIEKGRKALKRHSIKKKPKRNAKKSADPKYRAFYEQNEFNPALKQAWIMIGKAEFHKADFLGAVGTFSYIAKHYETNKDLVLQSKLWTARAYTEIDWLYEAEQILATIQQDEIKQSDIGLFAATNACLLIKREQYKEAIPFLELALSKEKEKYYKRRFSYLLAQLYQYSGEKERAEKAYSNVIKTNPPYEMAFNANVNLAQLKGVNNKEKTLKDLTKMSKSSKNKTFLDQIYGAMGNIHLQSGDTLKAIENYELAAQKSTRNAVEKANVLIVLADILYAKKEYVKAQEAYDEASKIISTEHSDYKRVAQRAEVLGELKTQHEIVVLQDSLQYLSKLPLEKQVAVVEKIIEDLLTEEKRAAEEEKLNEYVLDDDEEAENLRAMVGASGASRGSSKWYFYNPNIVNSGKKDFRKRWGNRKLEDNWRRINKVGALFGDNAFPDEEMPDIDDANLDTKGDGEQLASDNKNPAFYLQQIPKTEEEIVLSNQQIADALFKKGIIFKDKISDYPMAIEAFEEFIRRFGRDNRVSETLFQLFLIESKQKDFSKANSYKDVLLREHPNTKQAELLANPNYLEDFSLHQKQQDSLYRKTYEAYSKNNASAVFENVEVAKKNFPQSKLMPKFLFLRALTLGKTSSPESLEFELSELIESYPDSDVSAMAKDIVALIKQGKEVQSGTTGGFLLAHREDGIAIGRDEEGIAVKTFSQEKSGKHRLLLITSAKTEDVYQLMYQIASFNFSSFMIKEFDLQLSKLSEQETALSVTNFNSYEEVAWYSNSINKDRTLSALFSRLNTREIIISEENLEISRRMGLEKYLAFQKDFLSQETKFERPVFVLEKEENQLDPEEQVKTDERAVVKKQKTLPEKQTIEERESRAEEALVEKPKETQVTEQKSLVERKQESEKEPEQIATAKETIPVVQKEEETRKKDVQEEKESVSKTATSEVPKDKIEETTPVKPETVVQEKVAEEKPEKEEEVDLYKGLFAYQPDKAHYIAIYVLSGKINFDKFKSDLEAYNASNYNMLNLSISYEPIAGKSVIIIGDFQDANIAKSYLMRIIKEREVYSGLRGSNYRNLLGTKRNLNTMIKNDALSTYSEFMQEFYLK